MIRVSARSRLRCAYCHADAFGAVACVGCRTLVHPACSAEVGRCPTLGCLELPASLREPEPGGWAKVSRVAIDLGLAAAVLITLSTLTLGAVTKLSRSLDRPAQPHDTADRTIRTRITDQIR